MSVNNCYQVIENLRLVIVVHKGNFNLSSIKYIIRSVKGNPYFNPTYKVLIDLRNADIRMSSEEVMECSEYVYNNFQLAGKKMLAILASTAEQAIKAVEFVHYYKKSSDYQVFSNINAALSWLGVDIKNKDQIELRLECLNLSPEEYWAE